MSATAKEVEEFIAVTIKCSICGWSLNTKNYRELVNKKCPDCNEEIILTLQEAAFYDTLIKMGQFYKLLIKKVLDDVGKENTMSDNPQISIKLHETRKGIPGTIELIDIDPLTSSKKVYIAL